MLEGGPSQIQIALKSFWKTTSSHNSLKWKMTPTCKGNKSWVPNPSPTSMILGLTKMMDLHIGGRMFLVAAKRQAWTGTTPSHQFSWKVTVDVWIHQNPFFIQNPPNTWWGGLGGTPKSRSSGGVSGFKHPYSAGVWMSRESNTKSDSRQKKAAVGRKSEVNDDPSFQDPHLSIFLDLLVRWLENSTNIFPKWVVKNGVLDLMEYGRNRKKRRLSFVCFCGLNFSLNKSIPLILDSGTFSFEPTKPPGLKV